MPPNLYEILPPLQRSQRNTSCFKPLKCRTELFQNSFFRCTISEWNRLDLDVRNVDIYLLFCKNLLALIRPIENNIYSNNDPLGIKLLHRLRLGFSDLREHTFRHNFPDTVNPLC